MIIKEFEVYKFKLYELGIKEICNIYLMDLI